MLICEHRSSAQCDVYSEDEHCAFVACALCRVIAESYAVFKLRHVQCVMAIPLQCWLGQRSFGRHGFATSVLADLIFCVLRISRFIFSKGSFSKTSFSRISCSTSTLKCNRRPTSATLMGLCQQHWTLQLTGSWASYCFLSSV